MENPYKEEFRAIFQQHVTRRGGDQLLEWLENTDFYTAPASTKFHCACEFGLVMHSLNVYKVLREKYFEEGDSEESFALAIRWHMGGFDEAVKGGSFAISAAYDRYPLAVKLHLSDLEATYLREHGTSEIRR